jgi:hypothetical protein
MAYFDLLPSKPLHTGLLTEEDFDRIGRQAEHLCGYWSRRAQQF